MYTKLLIAAIIFLVILLFLLFINPASKQQGAEHFDNPILQIGKLKHSEWNTKKVKCSACKEGYNVHKEHHDPVEAAKLIAEINKRNLKLIEHLQQKYIHNPNPGFDPDKTGAIDVIPIAKMFSEEHIGSTSEFLQERVNQLIKNYESENISEISPLNSKGNTSYTENKKHLVLCLRKKQADNNGLYNLHDINTMMFVVIHELAHMMNNGFGHTDGPRGFWALFRFMLENAVEAGIYIPVDYSKHPIVYCGLLLSYNPLFEKSE